MAVMLFSAISFFAGAVCLLFGTLVLLKDNHSPLNRIFMLLCMSMAYWGFMEFELRHSVTLEEAAMWSRLNFLWPISVALVVHFVLIFTKQARLLKNKFTYLALYGTTATLSILDVSTRKMVGTPFVQYWGWTYDTPDTFIYHLSSGIIVIMAISALIIAFRFHLQQRDPVKRKQSGLVLVGLAIPIILGSGFDAFLPAIGIRVPEMTATSFALGAAGFIGFAIWKYELFGITAAQAADNILATISDSLFIVNPRGMVITVNKAATDLLGYSKKELEDSHLGMIFGEGEMTLTAREVQGDTCAVLDVTDMETYLIAKNGRRILVSLSSSTLRDKRDQVLGKVIVARDMTQRKLAEEKILAQSADLRTANMELLTLNRISAEISQTIDLRKLLHYAIVAITDSQLFEVQKKGGILIAEGDKLHLAAQLGHDEKFLEAHQELTFDDCLCGLAARTGEPVVSSSSESDKRHTIHYEGMKEHGHAVIPLKIADRVVGVMYLYLSAGASIDDRGLSLLTTIGNQLAVSIENARLFERTKELSLHDPLTGLANRNMMNDELQKAIAVSRRTARPVSVIMLDLDHFKRYNDTYGHRAGDRLLVKIASAISNEIREIDLAARYGGEEFLAILPDTSLESASLVAERIRNAIGTIENFPANATTPIFVTVSLGVATWDRRVTSEDMLIARADAALYSAKNHGRNRVEVWQPRLFQESA